MSPSNILIFLSLIALSSANRSRNPCHPNRSAEKLGTSCEEIVLPPKMCRKCRLRGYDAQGYLNDCESIYRIEDPECRAEIQNYVDLNPCDTVRAEQMSAFDDDLNRKGLDYFVYSICEECCDCIPRDAEADKFDEMKKNKTLISLVRGNCPAHAHYDICRVWPEVRTLTVPGIPFRQNLPKICPLIRSWFFSDLSKGWASNDNIEMDWRIRRFLRMFNRFARCRNKQTWQMCVGLESAQNRI